MADQFIGTWELVSSENFEEYMIAIGINEEMRKLAESTLSVGAKLKNIISKNDDEWVFQTQTPKGNREIKFKLGQEIDSVSLEGRKVKQTTTLEGDRMIEVTKGDGFDSRAERYLETPDIMVTKFEGNGCSCVRKYNRVA